jgi:DNA-binding FadR family transcriptional regulator
MIVEGELSDGDYLPSESEMVAHFQVSRPTMREAVRVLESERLLEIRRGSRTGPRVCVPGPEIVARPGALILEISGATLGDVMTARIGIEPIAARLLAETGTEGARKELDHLVSAIPQAWAAGELGQASANLHLRMVELSGNAALSMIAGMLHEIAARHTTDAVHSHQHATKEQYNKLLRSYRRLVQLVNDLNGAGAEAHWRRHMENASTELLRGYENTRVRDIMA